MTTCLIVNADDYGRTPGVSLGIREAHLRGIVTSTTVLMNTREVREELGRALSECPHLGLGVHLVLTSGGPVLPASQVPSLTHGRPAFPDLAEQAERLSRLDPAEVKAEWHAQIERFVAVTGRAPDHLDSHHHVSYFSEALFRAMLELSDEYGCAVRVPRPDSDGTIVGLPSALGPGITECVMRLVSEFAPRRPDHFEGTFYGERATQTALLDFLASLPSGVTELMCHPGYADAELVAGSTYNRQRETELRALTDSAVLALVKERGIRRITFQDLGLDEGCHTQGLT